MKLGVVHNLPATVIGSPLLKDLIQFLQSKASTICPQNYLANINRLAEIYKEKVLNKLNLIQYCAATTDLRTSDELTPFIAVTIHRLEDSDLMSQSLVLCCEPFDQRHTIENINKRLVKIIDTDYKIVDKLAGISTDNAKNMNIGRHDKLKHIVHIKCLCHTIDLVLKDTHIL